MSRKPTRSPSPLGRRAFNNSDASASSLSTLAMGFGSLFFLGALVLSLVFASIAWDRTRSMCSPGVLPITQSGALDPYHCVQTLEGGVNLTIRYLEVATNPSYIGKTYRVISLDGIQHVLWAEGGTYFHGAYAPPGTTMIIFNYNDPGLTGSCLEVTPITATFVQVCACGGNGNGFFYGVHSRKKMEQDFRNRIAI